MLNPADDSQTRHLSSRRVLLPLGLAICLSLFGDLSLYAVLAGQADVVGLSLAAVGIMLGVNRLIRIPLNPLAGAFYDRFDRRRLFLLGMAIGSLSVAGFSIARGFWPFLLTRLGWGIAWTLINVGGMTMVLDVSTPAATTSPLPGTDLHSSQSPLCADAPAMLHLTRSSDASFCGVYLLPWMHPMALFVKDLFTPLCETLSQKV